jgi:hypothetical protein
LSVGSVLELLVAVARFMARQAPPYLWCYGVALLVPAELR